MGKQDSRVLLRKAEMAVTDFASGGVLVAEQADKFIVQMINQAILLPMCTSHPMDSPTAEYPKLRFTEVSLSTNKFQAEVRFSEDVLEEQIERGTFQQTLTNALTEAIARDMEYIAINGDTSLAATDPDLGKMDGFLKLAATNLVNGAGGSFTRTMARSMWKQIPAAFRRGKSFQYFTHIDTRADYKDSLADRMDELGGVMVVTSDDDDNLNFNGHKIHAVDEFPEASGTGYTSVLACDPKGLHVGVLRKVKIKVGEDISADQVIIVATVKYGVAIEEVLAVSKAYDVATA
jgi:hypothetical protein